MSTFDLRLFNINRAIEKAGGVAQLGKALGVTHQAVCLWRKKGVVPVERAVDIERLYGIPAVNIVSPQLASMVRRMAAQNA